LRKARENPASLDVGQKKWINPKEIPMKRVKVAFVLLALIAVFLAAGPVGKVQADPSPHGDISGFCSDNDDFGMSHGECVSVAEANINALEGTGNADGVAICKMMERVFGPFPLGQCISRFARF
jgi:hypothetical protein